MTYPAGLVHSPAVGSGDSRVLEIPIPVGERFSPEIRFDAFDVEAYGTFIHRGAAYQIGQYEESFQVSEAEPMEIGDYFFIRWEKEHGVWKIDPCLTAPREESIFGWEGVAGLRDITRKKWSCKFFLIFIYLLGPDKQ